LRANGTRARGGNDAPGKKTYCITTIHDTPPYP
jgi:hypothetical protein